jgi:putative transposase
MKTEGMQVKTKRKFKATPYSDHDDPIAPNLLNRALTVDKPDLDRLNLAVCRRVP